MKSCRRTFNLAARVKLDILRELADTFYVRPFVVLVKPEILSALASVGVDRVFRRLY